MILDEDFYGGRTGPLEKFYLFIFFLLMIFGWRFLRWPDGAIRKILFIYFLLMISDEDFYGGRTGPLENFYLFISFLLMISDEDFYGGRTGPLEKFYLFISFLLEIFIRKSLTKKK